MLVKPARGRSGSYKFTGLLEFEGCCWDNKSDPLFIANTITYVYDTLRFMILWCPGLNSRKCVSAIKVIIQYNHIDHAHAQVGIIIATILHLTRVSDHQSELTSSRTNCWNPFCNCGLGESCQKLCTCCQVFPSAIWCYLTPLTCSAGILTLLVRFRLYQTRTWTTGWRTRFRVHAPKPKQQIHRVGGCNGRI